MSLDRRDALKTLGLSAGAMFLTPILSRIEAQAAGKPVTAKRFVFVVESNGLPQEQICPVGITRKNLGQAAREFQDVSLKDKVLPFAMEPVKDWQDKVTIVQGLSARVCPGGHSNNFSALGSFSMVRESQTIVDATVDGALAKHLGGIFPHIGLGISKRPEMNVIYNISASGPSKGLPTIVNPMSAYSSLFGSVADGAARQEFAAKNTLLDFLKDDVKRAEAKIAGAEREQFHAYLETFETLRDRQSKLNDIKHTLREKGPVVSDKYKSAVETDRLDAQFDIGAAALICGLTNVLTLSSAAGSMDFDITFKGLGLNVDKHSIGHGGSYQGKTWDVLSSTIRRYHFDLIAGLMKKLEKVPEGDGTMLDNTVIVYLSDGAEGHHSRCWEWPMVVIGNMGGKLKTGRFVDYPNYGHKSHRTTANMYLTLLHLAGAKRDTFGMPDPGLKDIDQTGPLSELLA